MTNPNWQIGLPELVQSYYLPTPVDGKVLGWLNDELVNVDAVVPPPINTSSTWCGTAAGSANAIVLVTTTPIASYIAGSRFSFVATAQNTSAVTVSISGLAAISVKTISDVPLLGSEIKPGIVDIIYDGSAFRVFTTIPFVQTGAGAVSRTVDAKLKDADKYLEDFGGGTALSDNTAAFTLALAHMALTGENIRLRRGTYLCDPFVMDVQFYDLQGQFIGVGKRKTIIKRRVNGAGPFVQVGKPSATIFAAGGYFRDLTLDGGLTTNGDCFVAYDMVRACLDNVRFQGGAIACHLYGGISVTFKNPTMDLAAKGFKAEKFTSLAGGGYPNLIRISGGEIVDNTVRGIEFDHGQQLILSDGVQVENNGTTLGDAAHGGIWIGPNIGEAVFVSDNLVPGLICDGAWIETNKGRDAVTLEFGINSLENCEFFQQSTQVTNDINVIGGRYHLNNVNIGFSKSFNILEGAGVVSGNTIVGTDAPSISFNALKTSISTGDKFFLRGGESPAVLALSKPVSQQGIHVGAVTGTVTFPVAYAASTTPFVVAFPINNNAGTIDQIDVYSITNTGFTFRKKSFNGTTIGTVDYTMQWQSLGQGS